MGRKALTNDILIILSVCFLYNRFKSRYSFRLFFGERNIKGMFKILEPLHNMMERGPQTLKETSFNQAYGRDLAEAQERCQRYKVSFMYSDFTRIAPTGTYIFSIFNLLLDQTANVTHVFHIIAIAWVQNFKLQL